MSWEEYLKEIYYNPANAGSFGGPDKLYRYVQKAGKYVISKYKIRKWLQRQEAYSLQRSMRKRFRRNKVVVAGLDDQWDADLMDMTKFSKDNDGYSYILVVIDIFSKYLWMRPLKDKKGDTTVRAFKDVLRDGRKPSRLRTDKGQEFRSRAFNDALKERGINHFYSQNTEVKANFAERAIKTIKTRITRYMTYKQSSRYVDQLQTFAQSYNSTYHRTIGTRPESVKKENEEEVRVSSFLAQEGMPRKRPKRPFKFKVGDRVRISAISSIFDREYDQKWSGEIFTISHRFLRNDIPVYKIKDYDGEAITGTFYQPELQKIEVRDDDTFKVEKILKTKGRGHNKQYLVKWLHWPSKFNSWIKTDDLQNL